MMPVFLESPLHRCYLHFIHLPLFFLLLTAPISSGSQARRVIHKLGKLGRMQVTRLQELAGATLVPSRRGGKSARRSRNKALQRLCSLYGSVVGLSRGLFPHLYSAAHRPKSVRLPEGCPAPNFRCWCSKNLDAAGFLCSRGMHRQYYPGCPPSLLAVGFSFLLGGSVSLHLASASCHRGGWHGVAGGVPSTLVAVQSARRHLLWSNEHNMPSVM